MLADVRWEGGVQSNHTHHNEEEVNTLDRMTSIIVALIASGAGIAVFSRKKKDKN
jgi:hypothetical protein